MITIIINKKISIFIIIYLTSFFKDKNIYISLFDQKFNPKYYQKLIKTNKNYAELKYFF